MSACDSSFPSEASADLAMERAWNAQIAAQTLNINLGTERAVARPVKVSGFEVIWQEGARAQGSVGQSDLLQSTRRVPLTPDRLAETPPASASPFRVNNAGAWSTTRITLPRTRSSAFDTYSSVVDVIFSETSSIFEFNASAPPRWCGRTRDARSGANASVDARGSARYAKSFMFGERWDSLML